MSRLNETIGLDQWGRSFPAFSTKKAGKLRPHLTHLLVLIASIYAFA
jgi:hypothetical protein